MAGADDDLAAGYELAYSEARRALEDQDQSVNELRSRAGVLMAAAAITTSFFGGQALTGRGIGVWDWLAIASFVVLGATVLMVLWPRHDWQFTVDAEAFIRDYLEPASGEPLPCRAIHRDLALHMSASYKSNRDQYRRLISAFRVGEILLILEVASWVVALVQRR